MSATKPDVSRLQPTSHSLNVILKNTFFRDNILDKQEKIVCKVDYRLNIPVLIFKFSEPYYDFMEVLEYEIVAGLNQEWMGKENIAVKLILADSVITDQLTSREFIFSAYESDDLRKQLLLQKLLSHQQIEEMVASVYENANKLLQ